MTAVKKFQRGRGYSKKDWDEVSNPELTDRQLAKGKSFKDAFPELYASIKRSRGRPKVDSPKEAITLRVTPQTVERFKATGKDWRARMAKALERAKV